jgi:hypothetical protein
MSAPQYVPRSPDEPVRAYRSNPWRPESWEPDRPGDLSGPQPSGALFGDPGPDQGYMLLLAQRFEDQLVLAEGEKPEDVLAGAVAVANRRAALFGRAPVVHDLTVALTAFGFLDEAPGDLVAFRGPLFAEVGHHHHYEERRRLAALVPESALRSTPAQVREIVGRGWRHLFAPVPAA